MKVAPHKIFINYKGKNSNLQYRNLADNNLVMPSKSPVKLYLLNPTFNSQFSSY